MFAVLFIADQATKWWAQDSLPHISLYPPKYPYGGISIFYDFLGVNFSLVFATNKGAAWGLFSSYPYLLLAFRSFFVSVLAAYFFLGKIPPPYRWGSLLLFSGAFSNIFDVFWYGSVIDMLKFDLWGYEYPVFNLADAAIFIGISLIILRHYAQRD